MLDLNHTQFDTVQEGQIVALVAGLTLTATATRTLPPGTAPAPETNEAVAAILRTHLWDQVYREVAERVKQLENAASESGDVRLLTLIHDLQALLRPPLPTSALDRP